MVLAKYFCSEPQMSCMLWACLLLMQFQFNLAAAQMHFKSHSHPASKRCRNEISEKFAPFSKSQSNCNSSCKNLRTIYEIKFRAKFPKGLMCPLTSGRGVGFEGVAVGNFLKKTLSSTEQSSCFPEPFKPIAIFVLGSISITLENAASPGVGKTGARRKIQMTVHGTHSHYKLISHVSKSHWQQMNHQLGQRKISQDMNGPNSRDAGGSAEGKLGNWELLWEPIVHWA